MMTHYGLQIQSPFDLKEATTVVVSVKSGETRNADRGGAVGVLAFTVAEGGTLNYTENVSEAGLYHTYIYLQGDKSSVNIISKSRLTKGIVDISHQVVHEHSHTASKIIAKGVISGESTAIYTSKISVNPSQVNVVGEQDAHFLLLDEDSKVKTIPGLSVYSEEVSCSHRVSITPIDKVKVDFLASRGFAEVEARQMLIEAFLK